MGRLAVPVAKGRARLAGLARLDQEEAGPGLLIPHCHSVHTFGMRFPLDLVFLGKRQDIIRIVLRVKPGQVVSTAGATAVLEVVPRGEWPSLDGIERVFAGARSMGAPASGDLPIEFPSAGIPGPGKEPDGGEFLPPAA